MKYDEFLKTRRELNDTLEKLSQALLTMEVDGTDKMEFVILHEQYLETELQLHRVESQFWMQMYYNSFWFMKRKIAKQFNVVSELHGRTLHRLYSVRIYKKMLQSQINEQ